MEWKKTDENKTFTFTLNALDVSIEAGHSENQMWKWKVNQEKNEVM